jgi:hypothetical protein
MSASTNPQEDGCLNNTSAQELSPGKEHNSTSTSPVPSLSDTERQNEDCSALPADGATATTGPDQIEAPPKEIRLLGAVPEEFGPAYDYLGKVKELADEIGPDVYRDLFERHLTQGDARVSLHTLTEELNQVTRFGNVSERIFENIKLLREIYYPAEKNARSVLLVEAINEAWIQALGMAFDVSPYFFATHLQSNTLYSKSAELVTLSERFDLWARSRNGKRSRHSCTSHSEEKFSQHCSSVVTYSQLEEITMRRLTQQKAEPGPEMCQITIGNEHMGLFSQFSESEGSRNCCKVYTFPEIEVEKTNPMKLR